MARVPADESGSKGSFMKLVTSDEQHQKAVSCYSYDKYVDSTFDLSLEDDVLNLADFKKSTKFVVTVPSQSLKLVGSRLHRKVKFKLSTHGCRTFVSSVITSLQKNSRSGRCFGQFNSSNILATPSGRAKFKRVKMLPAGPDTKRLMFESTWQLIRDQFQNDDEIPQDIAHLINLIRSKPKKEMLFAVHSSLVPEDDKCWFFIKMYEYVKYRASKTNKDLILGKLPYLTDWRSIVHKCDVLVEAFEHQNADYAALGDWKDGKPTTPFEKMLHEAEKLIDLIRNGISHRFQRKTFVTPAEHQRIIDVFFPRLLPEMQEAIFDVIGEKEFQAVFLKDKN